MILIVNIKYKISITRQICFRNIIQYLQSTNTFLQAIISEEKQTLPISNIINANRYCVNKQLTSDLKNQLQSSATCVLKRLLSTYYWTLKMAMTT